MIPPSLYKGIYLIIISILTLFISSQYQNRNGLSVYRDSRNNIFSILFTIALILFIGFRPLSGRHFVDMANYATFYSAVLDGAVFQFNSGTDNIIFDNLFAWWGSARLGYTSFFLLIAAIYFGAAYCGIKKLFPNNTLAAYVVFLAAFSTFSYATNGIKAGAAASMFILAMGYRDNLKVCIPLVLITLGFHHSMIMVVAAFVMTLFIKNPKFYFVFWVFCLFMAAAHVTAFAQLFSGFTTEHGAEYLLGDNGVDGTKGGFRIDFIIYSSVPVIVGWYAVFRKRIELSKLYKDLLNLYLCLNGIWMLCMYAEFTNRIAYLSWFIYPIVLIYPFLKEQMGGNRYRTFTFIMIGHLCFTLFMDLIYYG